MKGNATHNVSVISDSERRQTYPPLVTIDPDAAVYDVTLYDTAVGFRATCSCEWAGPFREADEAGEGYSHDQAHRDATEDADIHALGGQS